MFKWISNLRSVRWKLSVSKELLVCLLWPSVLPSRDQSRVYGQSRGFPQTDHIASAVYLTLWYASTKMEKLLVSFSELLLANFRACQSIGTYVSLLAWVSPKLWLLLHLVPVFIAFALQSIWCVRTQVPSPYLLNVHPLDFKATNLNRKGSHRSTCTK